MMSSCCGTEPDPGELAGIGDRREIGLSAGPVRAVRTVHDDQPRRGAAQDHVRGNRRGRRCSVRGRVQVDGAVVAARQPQQVGARSLDDHLAVVSDRPDPDRVAGSGLAGVHRDRAQPVPAGADVEAGHVGATVVEGRHQGDVLPVGGDHRAVVARQRELVRLRPRAPRPGAVVAERDPPCGARLHRPPRAGHLHTVDIQLLVQDVGDAGGALRQRLDRLRRGGRVSWAGRLTRSGGRRRRVPVVTSEEGPQADGTHHDQHHHGSHQQRQPVPVRARVGLLLGQGRHGRDLQSVSDLPQLATQGLLDVVVHLSSPFRRCRTSRARLAAP